jgi:hypothetical protein
MSYICVGGNNAGRIIPFYQVHYSKPTNPNMEEQ